MSSSPIVRRFNRTSAAPHPYLEWDGPIPFAHRGGASEAPENTMPAFQYAIDLGYRYIETDVQVTSDGVLVAFHDFNLQRTCGIDRRIAEMTWDQLQQARVDGVAPIPTLEEMLGAWPEARVNIDCKSDAAVPALVAALRRTKALDRVCVGAFSDRRVRRLRSILGAELCTALGPGAVSQLRYGRSFRAPGQAAQVPVRQGPLLVINQKFVDHAHQLGIAVHAWIIDDEVEIERLLDLGVDGIMTDRPAVLHEVMERRGVWSQG
ncbi:MAG: glycerophosphodiester phosphodiesterase [Ilumatobacteraceae bacterium]